MTTVTNLISGDLVTAFGESATFVAQTQHPIWPWLQLVIWKLADGTWSHDALDARQQVGPAQPAGPLTREARLRRALLGGTAA